MCTNQKKLSTQVQGEVIQILNSCTKLFLQSVGICFGLFTRNAKWKVKCHFVFFVNCSCFNFIFLNSDWDVNLVNGDFGLTSIPTPTPWLFKTYKCLLLTDIGYFILNLHKDNNSRINKVISKVPYCLLEQETLPLLLSTGWFQERIRAWFHNRTKINWGPYERLT